MGRLGVQEGLDRGHELGDVGGCAAWAAPSIVTTWTLGRRARSASVAAAKGSRLALPRTSSTGFVTPPSASRPAATDASASSSRRIVGAAAARTGQMGSAL